jgi:hypothetical protein
MQSSTVWTITVQFPTDVTVPPTSVRRPIVLNIPSFPLKIQMCVHRHTPTSTRDTKNSYERDELTHYEAQPGIYVASLGLVIRYRHL